MPSISTYRRVKRPTILAKRSALAKKKFYNKRSYKPLYEKVKGNNNALAKSLSQEKQENQYLFSENLALKSQTQELTLALNRRDDIISGVLKNAKDTLGLLVTATNYVTNTIASCQQVINMPKFTPRKSTSGTDRRESNRRLSGKSPARGVVQPMVSGHTITKPTINLSRLNIQREYANRNHPNLSDIEESSTTPEQSPASRRSASPAQAPIPRTLNCDTRRVNRMPERLRRTLRASDESPRRSSGRGPRNSSRHSIRRSREMSEVSSSHINQDESLRNPRVSLHDVSRLLHNAQSVNIRTLLEASNDMDLTNSGVSTENHSISERQGSPMEADPPDPIEKSPSSSALKAKRDSSVRRDTEDPLEGPSWLLNDSEVALSSTSPVNNNTTVTIESNEARPMNNSFEETGTVNVTGTLPYRYSNEYRDWNEDDMRTDSNLPCFVTRKRGSRCDDTDDFTLMWRKPPPKNYHFDLNDLELPVIESPIVKAPEVRVPEPEMTANIQAIQTQNFANLTSLCRPIVDPDEETMYQYPTGPPPLSDNSEILSPTVVAQNERSDDDDDDADSFTRHLKRPHKKTRIPVIDSPSDSDYYPTPKRQNSKTKRKLKTKDPSSAKVVLLKLKDDRISKSALSPETQPSEEDNRNVGHSAANPDPSSDSEMSNASSTKLATSTGIQGRPRRQKAPKNLQEPSLGKKLRRK